jgi:hypothetical protein
MIARQKVTIGGIEKEMAIEASGYTFLLPNNPMTDWILSLDIGDESVGRFGWQVYHFIKQSLSTEFGGHPLEAFGRVFQRQMGSIRRTSMESLITSARKAVEESSWRIFSRHLWTREEKNGSPFESLLAAYEL